MSTTPFFSIIIPTYNRPDYLYVALLSLHLQVFKDFEVIVVNDGTTPVNEVLEKFSEELYITLVDENPGVGLSNARNKGIKAARGIYLCYLDDDDMFYDIHLEVLHTSIVATHCHVAYTDAVRAHQTLYKDDFVTTCRNVFYADDYTPQTFITKNGAPVMCFAHARQCINDIGSFSSALKSHEDWDFWQRMAHYYPMQHLSCITVECLMREGTMSKNKDIMAITWLFVRRQGHLLSSLPRVPFLEQYATEAKKITHSSTATAQASVILYLGVFENFMKDNQAQRAFVSLCKTLGNAELILIGTGDFATVFATAKKHTGNTPCCILTPKESGRTFAHNLGANAATTPWLIFMEPDLIPEQDNWLETMVDKATKQSTYGVFGALIKEPNLGTLCGGTIRNDKLEFCQTAEYEPEQSLVSVDYISSHCLMIHRDSFFTSGQFARAFAPGFYADADLCQRIYNQNKKCAINTHVSFIWNAQGVPLMQTSAALLCRRIFSERHINQPYPLETLLEGSSWTLRPRKNITFYLTDGVIPDSFDFKIPVCFRSS